MMPNALLTDLAKWYFQSQWCYTATATNLARASSFVPSRREVSRSIINGLRSLILTLDRPILGRQLAVPILTDGWRCGPALENQSVDVGFAGLPLPAVHCTLPACVAIETDG